jgi:hypothetical protein
VVLLGKVVFAELNDHSRQMIDNVCEGGSNGQISAAGAATLGATH